MSIVPKIAGYIVAIRFFEFFVASDIEWVKNLLYIIAILTMTMGNIMALVQEDVKRMLAFSSISHAGFAMVAILVGTTQSNSALFLYWFMFMFANLGAFTMLWISRHKSRKWHDRYDHPFTKFAGMIHAMPVAASIMALFMLSLAGVPPFSLFWGKMYLISSVINGGYILLPIIMALNSAVAAYYYLKLIVYMFLKPLSANENTIYMSNASMPLKTIIGLAAFISLISISLVNPLLEFITHYVQMSGF